MAGVGSTSWVRLRGGSGGFGGVAGRSLGCGAWPELAGLLEHGPAQVLEQPQPVHPVQVTARFVLPWTVLDGGELQLKLQLSLFIRLRVLRGTTTLCPCACWAKPTSWASWFRCRGTQARCSPAS